MKALAVAALAWLTLGIGAAGADETNVRSAGSWTLTRSTNDTTHTVNCVLAPKRPSRIQVDRHRLVVSGLPRQSILNYQYIVDDEPASIFQFPSEAMQESGSIYLDGAVFDAILNARRLRVRVLDKWHEAIAEDVDLAGLSELHRKMVEECR